MYIHTILEPRGLSERSDEDRVTGMDLIFLQRSNQLAPSGRSRNTLERFADRSALPRWVNTKERLLALESFRNPYRPLGKNINDEVKKRTSSLIFLPRSASPNYSICMGMSVDGAAPSFCLRLRTSSVSHIQSGRNGTENPMSKLQGKATRWASGRLGSLELERLIRNGGSIGMMPILDLSVEKRNPAIGASELPGVGKGRRI